MGLIKNYYRVIKSRMAEWLALQTGMRGDTSSIPAEIKTFFQRNQELFSEIFSF